MMLEQFMLKISEAHKAFSVPENGRSAACLCLMLDHWQRLRDQYGYSGLVQLLGQVQGLIVNAQEGECHVCRLNERTLLVLIPGSSIESVEKLAAKLFKQFDAETFEIRHEAIALSVSLGYCEFDHRFTSADRLLIELVDATQESMVEGGNALIKVTPDLSLGQVSSSERRMLGLLLESLRKNSIRVFFQPLMATAAEPEKIFQVLPRLSAADGSPIPAASFLGAARKGQVLGVLDRWMLQQTVKLLTNEYQLLPVRLFLSQSEALLQESERRQWLSRLVERHPEVSGRLVLDFAVEDALAHLQGAEELMDLAKPAGIALCFSRVDEHSKWHLLSSRLRPAYLKMSPDFVHRLTRDSALEFEFQSLSAPIRRKGTKIIMPMVEDASVAALLWRTGADYMQGHMIQKETETLNLGD